MTSRDTYLGISIKKKSGSDKAFVGKEVVNYVVPSGISYEADRKNRRVSVKN